MYGGDRTQLAVKSIATTCIAIHSLLNCFLMDFCKSIMKKVKTSSFESTKKTAKASESVPMQPTNKKGAYSPHILLKYSSGDLLNPKSDSVHTNMNLAGTLRMDVRENQVTDDDIRDLSTIDSRNS